jgi:hypothetical protein
MRLEIMSPKSPDSKMLGFEILDQTAKFLFRCGFV